MRAGLHIPLAGGQSMNDTPAPRTFASGKSGLVIVAVLAASVVVLGAGGYGVFQALRSHDDVLPYRLAFSSTLNGGPTGENIFVLERDASMNQLTTSDGRDENPAWSPDGRRLAFARGGAIWVRDDAGTRRLSDLGAASRPSWSPDGKQIAYANLVPRSPNLGFVWLMDADGRNQHPIFNSDDPNAKPPDCFGGFPGGWYPSGERLLYRGSLANFPPGATSLGTLAICSAKTDGSNVKTIVEDPSGSTLNYAPAFSPDGTKIAFVSNRDGNESIYLMNPDGTGVAKLLDDVGKDLDPSWSPDGQWIAFSSNRDGRYHLYMVHPDGSGLTRLTSGNSDDKFPSWAPNPPATSGTPGNSGADTAKPSASSDGGLSTPTTQVSPSATQTAAASPVGTDNGLCTATATMSLPAPPSANYIQMVTGVLTCTSGVDPTGAIMHAVWHEKAADKACDATADATGTATCSRQIGALTSGYKVVVDVTFGLNGAAYATTSSFTPQ
jgi:Tol biopolymer transport system component